MDQLIKEFPYIDAVVNHKFASPGTEYADGYDASGNYILVSVSQTFQGAQSFQGPSFSGVWESPRVCNKWILTINHIYTTVSMDINEIRASLKQIQDGQSVEPNQSALLLRRFTGL